MNKHNNDKLRYEVKDNLGVIATFMFKSDATIFLKAAYAGKNSPTLWDTVDEEHKQIEY